MFDLTKKFSSDGKKYLIDAVATQAGHRVVKLSPYYCQYNPTELLRVHVKSHKAKNYLLMADLKLLVKRALSYATPQNLAQAVKHAKDLQEMDVKQDMAVD